LLEAEEKVDRIFLLLSIKIILLIVYGCW